jgi:hypothetical protein
VTVDDAIEIASKWLVEWNKPHGEFRAVYFLWRFELSHCAERFCHHAHKQLMQSRSYSVTDEYYVLVEKWRVVFEPKLLDPSSYIKVTVDVDDSTGQIRVWDGW